jgi:hypothetical protein
MSDTADPPFPAADRAKSKLWRRLAYTIGANALTDANAVAGGIAFVSDLDRTFWAFLYHLVSTASSTLP